jgi:hypothetical protein
LEQTRDLMIICAADDYGSSHLAAFSLLRGVNLTDGLPGIGTPQEILAKYRLAGHG